MKKNYFITFLFLLFGLISMIALVHAADVVPNEIQMPGTQPMEVKILIPAVEDVPGPWNDNTLNKACLNCHEAEDRPESLTQRWSGSMMAQAGRDPIFWATMAIAEQDFDGSGDLCLRCHAPRAWYDGRSTPTDGSAITMDDADGVLCELCHKMTNPDDSEHIGVQFMPFLANNYQDPFWMQGDPILGYYGSGMAVLWGDEERLGPYDPRVLDADHPVMQSQFHRDVDFCGTCHDVSNPAVGDLAPNNGSMVPLQPGTFSGALGTPVEEKAAFNNFPYKYGIVERTFSEYKAGQLSQTLVSNYSTLPAELRDGAIMRAYSASQLAGRGGDYADYGDDDIGARLTDFPFHDMQGGNYWMPQAMKYLYNRGKLRLTDELERFQRDSWDEGSARAKVQLENAGALSVNGDVLKVFNLTGHKLISGYPEGRRMWLNIKWYDASDNLIREDGAYGPIGVTVPNPAGGPDVEAESIIDLHDPNTKIYEAEPGITQDWAAKLVAVNANYYGPIVLGYDRYTGAPVGTIAQLANGDFGPYKKTFHFVLNNIMTHDNRIPTYGMSYDECLSRSCLPVPDDQYGNPGMGGTYDYWDEVSLNPPAGATSATINLLYQTTSWEYIQFLYLANNGSVPFLANDGMVMLEAWLNTGMSYPYTMASTTWTGDGGTCTPTPEACTDGVDNDCDSLVDCDDPDCSADPDCQVCTPIPENCTDGSDNDCDGMVDCDDQDCANNPACDVCVPEPEICNSVDDDCDGSIDEALGQTTCGIGECQVTVDNCSGGVPQTCTPGIPATEICDDGLDNDCDSFTDTNDSECAQVCVPTTSRERRRSMCTDGIDNDCDGKIDCEERSCRWYCR